MNQSQHSESLPSSNLIQPLSFSSSDINTLSLPNYHNSSTLTLIDSEPLPNTSTQIFESPSSIELFVQLPCETIESPSLVNIHPMITRSKDGITKSNVLLVNTTLPEPSSVTEVLQHPEWRDSMTTECNSLMKKKNTWALVPPFKGKKIIGNKWVHRVKLKADESLEKYKLRVVAKGYY